MVLQNSDCNIGGQGVLLVVQGYNISFTDDITWEHSTVIQHSHLSITKLQVLLGGGGDIKTVIQYSVLKSVSMVQNLTTRLCHEWKKHAILPTREKFSVAFGLSSQCNTRWTVCKVNIRTKKVQM